MAAPQERELLSATAQALQSASGQVLRDLLDRIATAVPSSSTTAATDALHGELRRREAAYVDAAALLERAIHAAPDLLPAYHCAALACVAAGDAARARSFWLALLARHVDDRIARYQIGLTFHDAGDLAEATRWYREQVRRFPGAAPAWYNLGLALYASGNTEDAVDAFATVTARDPQHRRAWLALGKAHRRLGDREAAVQAWLAADALLPHDAEPLMLAAAARAEDVELPEAIALLDRAIERDSRDASLFWTRGSHASNLGLHARALEDFRAALARDPADWQGHSRLLLELHYDDTLATADDVAKAHRAWATHIAGVARRAPASARDHGDATLRIGYISPRFGMGPLANFFLPVLHAHARPATHVTLYSAWPHGDAIAQQLQAACDTWQELPQDDDAAAAIIAGDRLDVLVDLAGHAPGHRLHVLARKPAPVQVTWLDYFDTTGVDAIDYMLSDAIHTPPADVPRFVERLALLPGCRFAYAPVLAGGASPPPCLANGYVTFGSFNRHAKITDAMLSTWRTILEQVPDARLQLRASAYRGPGTVRWLRERWARAGMPVDRIDFQPYVPLEEALRAYAEIDIALDTAPYNGGATTCDALVAGVPVVTLLGGRMIARQGASLLHAAGHPEWIAATADDYVRIAVGLARPATLRALRPALRSEMPRSALCDVPRFTRTLEHALRQLVALGPRRVAAAPPLELAP